MNCKIPFTKDIDFEKKLYEITSISLEHEIKVEDNTLKGNFIISGDFKSHEVSVNKEPFSYILPFEIALIDNIDENTIEFMIEDFTYEVIKNSILRVNIDFNVIGSIKEETEEKVEDLFRIPTDDDITLNKEIPKIEEEVEEIKEIEEIKEVPEITLKKEEKEMINPPKEIIINEEKEIKKETEDTIIDSIDSTTDEYATYHIHMVTDGESAETICTMYNSNINTLSDYNDLTNVIPGDKLIIPDKDE